MSDSSKTTPVAPWPGTQLPEGGVVPQPDDLLTTVKKALDEHDRFPDERAYDSDSECDCAMCMAAMAGDESLAVNWLGALLARCEAAEGCDGDCACVVLSRHEWQRAYSEERLKREAAEDERDHYRQDYEHHLCHPAHTTDASDGGVCVHCGRTLLALPTRREP